MVVNNAIVLIDYTNRLKDRGMTLTEAVIAAGATRLRPVMLTAVTTILGLLPMVTGISYDFHVMAVSLTSESSQWWRSMAIVVIFGLLVATVLTLVVVPVLYALIDEVKIASGRSYARARLFSWGPGHRKGPIRFQVSQTSHHFQGTGHGDPASAAQGGQAQGIAPFFMAWINVTMILAPVAPTGWPRPMPEPLMLVISRLRFSSFSHPRYWAANASFTSISSKSDTDRPDRFMRFLRPVPATAP